MQRRRNNGKTSDRSQGPTPIRRNRPRRTRNQDPFYNLDMERIVKEAKNLLGSNNGYTAGRPIDPYVRCESKANMLEAKKDLEADNNYYESDSCSEEDEEMYSSSEEYFPMSEEEEQSSDESDYSEDDSEYDSDDSEE